MAKNSQPSSGKSASQAATGIAGLDAILGGGLPGNHVYLLQGEHGSGKTTLGLQFCLEGARQGEKVLYLTTCETEAELRQIARSHGWSLAGVEIHYHDPHESLGEDPKQSVFHPPEVELPQTLEVLLAMLERIRPQRLVIDSLTEFRLMAADPRWFRRLTLALRAKLTDQSCTTLLCHDRPGQEQPGHSIVHGVIHLEQVPQAYGPDRRRLRVRKIRGQSFRTGYHDFRIRTGGIEVYPRLVAAEHRGFAQSELLCSNLPELDTLLGGGIDRGTSTLLMGPTGTGKSTVASQFVVAMAQRGERTAIYLFDERQETLLARTYSLGLDLMPLMERGLVEIQQVDPAELTPGEFSHSVQSAVSEREVRFVVLDSLAGYLHAMPNEQMLMLHLHELLTSLGQQEVTTLLTIVNHGLPGSQQQAPVDLSYIADAVLWFHNFEYGGELRKAISVYKRRSGAHETTLRELQFSSQGIRIGQPLRQFHGILTGTPSYVGEELPDVGAHDQS